MSPPPLLEEVYAYGAPPYLQILATPLVKPRAVSVQQQSFFSFNCCKRFRRSVDIQVSCIDVSKLCSAICLEVPPLRRPSVLTIAVYPMTTSTATIYIDWLQWRI